MSRFVQRCLSLVMLFIGFIPLSAAAAGPAHPTLPGGPTLVVKSITQSLPSLPQYAVELPYYRKWIPGWSHGRIQFDASTWAESDVSGADILRLVAQHQIDIGAAPMATVAGDLPFLEVADLAGLSSTVEQAQKVADAVVDIANTKLKRFGVRIIATYSFPINVIFCRSALHNLSGLRGRKVRTFGPSLNDLVTALGGQPVNIGFPEVYQALSTGVVDCAITGTTSGNASKWFEVTHYMYTLPMSWGTGGYYVNLRWWNGLAPDVRSFLQGVFTMIEADEWKLAATDSAAGIACNTGDAANCRDGTLVTQNPMIAIAPSTEDQAKLKSILETVVVPKWVARCGGASCGRAFNQYVAPIVGFRYTGK